MNSIHWKPEDHTRAATEGILKATQKNGQVIEETASVLNESIMNTNTLLEEINEKEYPTKMKVEIEGISVVTLKGDKGDKGEPGRDGMDGKDGLDGSNGTDAYIPEKGVDYFDGKDGLDGQDGKDGTDGTNGKDGKNGKDGTDGSPDTPEEIVEKVNKTEEKLEPKTIKGLHKMMKSVEDRDKNPVGAGSGGGVSQLKQLQDVRLTNPATDEVLKYDAASGKWINGTGGGGGAVDSVNGETGVVVLTTGDIAEDANANYVSDAQLAVIGNTSGTNTGDQDLTPYFNKSSDDTDDITEGTTHLFSQWDRNGAGFLYPHTTTDNITVGTNTSGARIQSNQIGTSDIALMLTGDGVSGGSDSTNGFTIRLGVNGAGNRQAWFGDSGQLNNVFASSFRYVVGFDVPIIDGISNDGSTRRNITFGTDTSNVGVGFAPTAVQADISAKLHVVGSGTFAKILDGSNSKLASFSDGTYVIDIGDSGNAIGLSVTDGTYDLNFADSGNGVGFSIDDGTFDFKFADGGNNIGFSGTDGTHSLKFADGGNNVTFSLTDGTYDVAMADAGNNVGLSIDDGTYLVQLADGGNSRAGHFDNSTYGVNLADGGNNAAAYLYNIGGKGAILDINDIATTDKTFTFPNATGTFVLNDNIATLTNKTIQAGIIDYVIEPSSDDTYEGESSNDLLAGDTIAQWDLVYLDSTSGRWEFADADAAATSGSVLLSLAAASGTDGNALNVVFRGVVRNDGWTWSGVGKPLYVSTTPGGMTETQPSGTDDVIRVVGYTLSDDAIYFNPSNNYITHT